MTQRRERRRGRRHGAAMMVWLFFANLFEPRKAASIEHVDRQKRLGAEATLAGRAAAAPPSAEAA